MKPVVSATVMSALLTAVTVFAMRAPNATLAVVSVMGAVIMLGWYAQLWSTEDEPGLDLLQPAAAVTLAVVGRRSWATLLPVVTGQVVGAVAVGLGAAALNSRLPETLAYNANGLIVAGAGGAIIGLFTAWAVLAVDGGGHAALTAAPVAVAAALPVALIAAFSPAVVLGLATADLINWSAAATAAIAGLIGAAIGAAAVGVLVPASE